MTFSPFLPLLVSCFLVMAVLPAAAADGTPVYVGGLFGVSTLSADGREVVRAPEAGVSLYKPENGAALSGLIGVHVHRFVSVQATYVGNRNRLTLLSSVISPDGGRFYEQTRSSATNALVADVLVYVRALDSLVRPYFSVGVGVVRFSSGRPPTRSSGPETAPGEIASTLAGLRVAVGIDVAVGDKWSVRYSFSDAMSRNPVSARLSPPGQRNLANFQSLFGIVRRL